MHLKGFAVAGLFGGKDHSINFPVPTREGATPSVVILYGKNGVGKTTILRMLDGLLRLDFNPFRRVPFSECELDFGGNKRLKVVACRDQGKLTGIDVSFADMRVRLHPEYPGAISDEERPSVERFRQAFFRESEDIAFEFIDTERLYSLRPQGDRSAESAPVQLVYGQTIFVRGHSQNPKARVAEQPAGLAGRVERFIQEAQLNYRTFFSTTEPDLFPRIIERLTSGTQPRYQIADLRERLGEIRQKNTLIERFGLEADRWDYDQLVAQLSAISERKGSAREFALTVAGSYVELLESNTAARALVADRLFTFERLMKEFFGDKIVSIHPRLGIRIQAQNGELLDEKQLSSGEFHLLFLTVAALVTRRRGTVIAIDEPEISMHLAWQRKLIPALVECASKAQPLFIFATHSPDVASSFRDAMVELR